MTGPRRVEADVLVLGGGMAGAMAALSARAGGARVALIRRSPGATALSSGAIAVAPDLGAGPAEPLAWRRGPVDAARRLAALRPEHPYALVGPDLARLPEALAFTARALDPLLSPALDRPRFLATPLGGAAGAALCQRSMAAGDLLTARGPLAVVGFRGHLGFDAGLVAAGLARCVPRGGPEAFSVEVELPFDDPAARPHELVRRLQDLRRRCRLAIGGCGGLDCARVGAQLAARELSWSADRVRAELADLLDQGWRERRPVLDGYQLAQEELLRAAHGLAEVP